MKNCPICEHPNKDIAAKCEHCGSDLFIESKNTIKFPKKTKAQFAAALQNVVFWTILAMIVVRVAARLGRSGDGGDSLGMAEVDSSMLTSGGQALASGSVSPVEGLVNILIWAAAAGLIFGLWYLKKRKKK